MGAAVARNLVFQPPVSTVSAETIITSNVDSSHVWLETRLGSRIESFFIDRRAPVTVLFSHANAEDVSFIYAWLRDLSIRLKVNVAGYSYTGYGRSEGAPSEAHVYADIDAVWDHLRETRGLEAADVVLYSRSVGSGPTLRAARVPRVPRGGATRRVDRDGAGTSRSASARAGRRPRASCSSRRSSASSGSPSTSD